MKIFFIFSLLRADWHKVFFFCSALTTLSRDGFPLRVGFFLPPVREPSFLSSTFFSPPIRDMAQPFLPVCVLASSVQNRCPPPLFLSEFLLRPRGLLNLRAAGLRSRLSPPLLPGYQSFRPPAIFLFFCLETISENLEKREFLFPSSKSVIFPLPFFSSMEIGLLFPFLTGTRFFFSERAGATPRQTSVVFSPDFVPLPPR